MYFLGPSVLHEVKEANKPGRFMAISVNRHSDPKELLFYVILQQIQIGTLKLPTFRDISVPPILYDITMSRIKKDCDRMLIV